MTDEEYLRDIDTQREFVWFGQGEGQAAIRNVRRIVDRYEAVLRRRGEAFNAVKAPTDD